MVFGASQQIQKKYGSTVKSRAAVIILKDFSVLTAILGFYLSPFSYLHKTKS